MMMRTELRKYTKVKWSRLENEAKTETVIVIETLGWKAEKTRPKICTSGWP